MGLRRAASAILAVLGRACLTGLFFFGLLTLWGLAAGPWIRLRSASFVIVSALVLAAALTALVPLGRAAKRRPGNGPRG